MNIMFTGIIIFVITFLLLSWFVKTSSKKLAKGLKNLIIALSFMIATILAIGGKILFSLPLFFLALSALKIKGLTAIQIWQIWKLLSHLRRTGRYFHFRQNNSTTGSSSLSTDEAYKILGLQKGCKKEEVIKAAQGLQKKIHPDVNPNSNTERLSQIINEAKESALKDFS